MTISTTKINNTNTNSNYGYIGYFKLYKQILVQIKDMKKLVGTFQDQLTKAGIIEKKLVTKWSFFQIKFMVALKTPWWLLIKPIGKIFSTKVNYKGTYSRYNDSVKIQDVKIVKKGAVLLFKVIPIFPLVGKLNKKDLENIFKEEACNVDMVSQGPRTRMGYNF